MHVRVKTSRARPQLDNMQPGLPYSQVAAMTAMQTKLLLNTFETNLEHPFYQLNATKVPLKRTLKNMFNLQRP